MAAGMHGCDVVFHSAAKVEDWGDPADFHRVNVVGTANVLQAARTARVPRLVHVGTEAVYAGSPMVDLDESRPLPARPVGLYPSTKAEAERLVRAANCADLATVVARPRLVWGAGDTTLLPEFVAAVKDGRFRWIGGGDFLCSTCHVGNVVEGLLLAAERGAQGGVYFLTDGPPTTMRVFLTELLATQGVDPGDRRAPRGLVLATAGLLEVVWRLFRLRGSPPVTRTVVYLLGSPVTVRDDRARRELGYEGRITREAGLAELRAAARR